MNTTIIFDIETGGLPEAELRALYREPTFEEFAAECDQRWKPETKAAKWEEARASGWNRFVERAALSPLTGQVLAVGVYYAGRPEPIEIFSEDEPDILARFWDLVDDDASLFIGHNIHGFDLPFFVRRSWKHRIAVPEGLIERNRYWSPRFIDTMAVWSAGDRNGTVSLDTLARFFGVGQKPEGIGGGDFARLWAGTVDERRKAITYLRNDLDMTAAVAERMGLL